MTEAGTSGSRAAEEAATWHGRLGRSLVSAEELAAFRDWRAVPENAAAYQAVEALWRQSGKLASDPDIAALTQDALDRTRGVAPPKSPPWLPGGLAAVAIALAAIGASATWMNRAPVYATQIGEQRTIRLTDGSVVALDTATRIRVNYRHDTRTLELLDGQALFTVAHDAERPFVVRSGEARVTALGTVFEVRKEAAGARVTLISGVVRVDDTPAPTARRWTLSAGQQVDTVRPQATAHAVDLAAETSWTQGRLLFTDTPLAQAVAEVNRYLEDPIVLQGAGVVFDVEVNGAFNTGDREAFAAAAVDLFDLEQIRREDGALILRDRPS